MPVTFFVPGTPVAKGSMKAFVRGGRAMLTNASSKTKPWQSCVTLAASLAWKGPPTIGAVSLRMKFVFARPKTAPKARVRPTVKPDCDKLCRVIFDAATGVIYMDDSQVVKVEAEKVYGELPGVHVEVEIV